MGTHTPTTLLTLTLPDELAARRPAMDIFVDTVVLDILRELYVGWDNPLMPLGVAVGRLSKCSRSLRELLQQDNNTLREAAEDYKKLRRKTNLQMHYGLSCKRLDDSDAKALARLFTAVSQDSSLLTDDEVTVGNLVHLSVDNRNIGDVGLAALAHALALANGALPSLHWVTSVMGLLSNNEIGKIDLIAQAEASAGEAPEPWAVHVDQASGRTFYHNPITEVTQWCHPGGAVVNLTHLFLSTNNIGDAGLTAFATKLRNGTLGNLVGLHLNNNHIGDAGMTALAGAIAGGSLRALVELCLSDNKIGDAGWTEFSRSIASDALGSLVKLVINNNAIGDGGLVSFAEAVRRGSLSKLQHLYFAKNRIGDVGVTSLAGALAGGALANLRMLTVADNDVGNAGVTALASALAGGAKLYT